MKLKDWDDLSESTTRSVWDEFKMGCPLQSEARRLFLSVGVENRNALSQTARLTHQRSSRRRLETISNDSKIRSDSISHQHQHQHQTLGGSKNERMEFEDQEIGFVNQSLIPILDLYCTQPNKRIEQGLFFSDTRKLSGLLPVFSASSAQGFGDIVIPSCESL